MRTKKSLTAGIVLAVLAVVPGTALAHGAGGRYELAVPQWLFLTGGGLVVVASFVAVSLISDHEDGTFSYRSLPISATPLKLLQRRRLVSVARFFAVVLVVVSVVSGLVGPESFNDNLLTNLVWVGWWIGYTFSVILVGNTWPILNPWKTSYEWACRLLGRELSLEYDYTGGHWPAVVLFLTFAWLEAIAPISESPQWMVALISAYSVYLWGGMVVFGVEPWLSNADPFTLLYEYLGRFAPISRNDEWELRGYGVGLIGDPDVLSKPGALAFLVAVLYTVTFDGFLGTPEWGEIARAAPELPVPYATSTLLMIIGFVLFYELYGTVSWLITVLVDSTQDEQYLAQRFAMSLLPVAIAYQLSHFFTYLLLQGQYLLQALVDPFGMGWNPVGLGAFEPSTTIPFLSVQLVWQLQVGLIVLGHVFGVWVAHHIALLMFEKRAEAVKSQIPMTGTMVVYTVVGLLILTRTVVEPPLP